MPGAGTRVLSHWLKWLDRNDHEVFVAAPGGGWLGKSMSGLKRKKKLDAEFFIPKSKDYGRFLVLVIRLCLFVVRNRIEIIHCNSDVAYFAACATARITRRPVVTHLRFHYQETFYSWLFGSWRRPDLVILVSNAFRDEEVGKIQAVVPSLTVKALHNCIDISDYPKPDADRQLASDYVFYPAAIAKRKRQLQLYRLDQTLQNNDAQLRLVAAGQSKDQTYQQQCREEAGKYPDNQVEFVGHVDDVAAMYQGAFASLTLSEYETFGYSVLESMASGVPVVGYRIDAVEEVLGESDFLVELDDVDGLARPLMRLRQDHEAWRAYSQRIRQRAENVFSPDHICPQLMAMYDEVLARRRPD